MYFIIVCSKNALGIIRILVYEVQVEYIALDKLHSYNHDQTI